MRRSVVVILDGLRRDFVAPDLTPNLCRIRQEAEWFPDHRSVVPSVTRVASSCIATGCYPDAHGLEGNALALLEDGRLVVHDAGLPEFFPHRKRVTGRSLDLPTLSERLAPHGGAAVFSNVSPGAAYAQDPDGFGTMYHRAGSHGPGRTPLDPPPVKGGTAGDRHIADRFLETLMSDAPPAHALLWLSEPDLSQHDSGIGSPEHLAALRAADEEAGRVFDAVSELRARGDDVLFIVGSDHGHQTVAGIVDIAAELDRLGFGEALAAGDIAIAPNGTAFLLYASEAARDLVPALAAAVGEQPWAGDVIAADALATVNHTDRRGLALYVSMAASEELNAFGVAGLSHTAKPVTGEGKPAGCGQHGGLGRYEQAPFLMIAGAGFSAGATRNEPTGLVDIAPTILAHLGIAADGMAGRSLASSSPAQLHPERKSHA
ncbi:alkaline phosphatase family protein [Rhodobium gokarnense]|uniref:Arylsulfatase A-like enzyme n=1 Tax=Rhodobium gokarnense TaxID=364296 RepID=A0ABT3H8H2_9HYPH|nr:alkaline phosphatase family protein [Rhodobium gokarnense]MCW2306688.1 arylsulfatase A-like enzyme [Rhodobium gokarnense]